MLKERIIFRFHRMNRFMNNLCPISWSTFYAMHKQYTYIFGKYIIYLYELQKQVTLFSFFFFCKKKMKKWHIGLTDNSINIKTASDFFQWDRRDIMEEINTNVGKFIKKNGEQNKSQSVLLLQRPIRYIRI
jgi:hypothetical protein